MKTLNKTQLEVKNLIKFSEVDNYNEGCDPQTGTSFLVDVSFKEDTQSELLSSICHFLDIEDNPNNYMINSCEEDGRIDFSLLENAEGYRATKNEVELWKKGRCKLWNAIYSAYVEEVYRTVAKLS